MSSSSKKCKSQSKVLALQKIQEGHVSWKMLMTKDASSNSADCLNAVKHWQNRWPFSFNWLRILNGAVRCCSLKAQRKDLAQMHPVEDKDHCAHLHS